MRPQRVPALPLLGLVRVRVLVLVRVRVLVPVPVRRPVQVLVQVQVLARRSGRATQALLPTVSQTICFPHRRGHQSAPGSRRVTNGTSHSRSVLTHTHHHRRRRGSERGVSIESKNRFYVTPSSLSC